VVEHAGQTATYRSSKESLSFVAFYADCRHHVRPVTSGYRIVLTYKLLLKGDTVAAAAGRADPSLTAELAGCLGEHFGDPDKPTRLVYLLDHEYTQRALGWARLKGDDASRAAMVRAATHAADCEVALALAEVHETWSTEDADSWQRRGWRGRYWNDDEDEDGPTRCAAGSGRGSDPGTRTPPRVARDDRKTRREGRKVGKAAIHHRVSPALTNTSTPEAAEQCAAEARWPGSSVPGWRPLTPGRSGLTDFAVNAGSTGSVNGGAGAVDPRVVGPAIDTATVVADLYAARAGVDGGDEVQVHGSRDSGQNDVADLDFRRVNWGDRHQLAAADQWHHRRATRAELDGGSGSHPTRHRIQNSHRGQPAASSLRWTTEYPARHASRGIAGPSAGSHGQWHVSEPRTAVDGQTA
jgi:hypothetical protein